MARKTPKDNPKIELYMYSLNQEFPAGKGHQSFLKRFSELQQDLSGKLVTQARIESQVFTTLQADLPADWAAQWVSNQWIENHTQAAGMGRREDFDPMRNAILREEDFGAILFEPNSDRVFKLNKSGAELFNAIRSQVTRSDREFKPKAMAGFKAEQVSGFIDYLKAAGLWSLT